MGDIIDFKPRPGQYQTSDSATDIVRSCPFCGECEALSLGEEEKILAKFEDGRPMIVEVSPTVFCEVCDASAPIETWNSRILPPGAA
ncbi:hypothetical protein [Caulobacter sp. SSI4214]|uniref:hypothetical protein n=1 Tax=Caulobacter sp. SSI4214 TaxID=2575739 RepID=UPI00143B6F76|nr:hypothetical protein [Caulobacter sp. SSI4214]